MLDLQLPSNHHSHNLQIRKEQLPRQRYAQEKKLKRVQVKDMKDLPLNQKVHALVGAL